MLTNLKFVIESLLTAGNRPAVLITGGLSQPHTSELNGGFSSRIKHLICMHTYTYMRGPLWYRTSVLHMSDYNMAHSSVHTWHRQWYTQWIFTTKHDKGHDKESDGVLRRRLRVSPISGYPYLVGTFDCSLSHIHQESLPLLPTTF